MDDDRLLNLRYWRELLSRQRILILGCLLAVSTLTGLFSFAQSPTYVSRCLLFMKRQKVQPLSFTDIFTQVKGRTSDLLRTQMQMLQSEAILERAVRDLVAKEVLYFTDDPQATPERGLKVLVRRLLGRSPNESLSAEMKLKAFAAALRGAMSVEPLPGNAFMAISVRSEDPQLAADLANTVVEVYLQSDREIHRRSTDEAIAWLTDRVNEQRQKLLKAEKSLRSLGPVPREAGEGTLDLETQEISRLQEALVEVRLVILQGEAEAAMRPKGELEADQSASIAARSDPIQEILRQRLQQELVELTLNLQEMRRRYGERHPDVIKAIEREMALRAQLEALGPQSFFSPQGAVFVDLQTLRAREKALSASLERSLRVSGSRGESETRYAILEREVELGRSLYKEMLSRLNELTISAGLDPSPAEVFELARPDPTPVSPDHQRDLLLGLIAGAFLGLAVAAVRDHLDQSVRNPEHANDILQAPVLAVIPHQGRDVWAKPGQASRPVVGTASSGTQTEAYRILRSHLEGVLGEEQISVLLLTSAVPGEGKTTTAANLAMAFAESGRRVLLVDGDLRRPSLGRYFGFDNGGRFPGVMRGDWQAGDAVCSTGMPGLDFLGGNAHEKFPDEAKLPQAFCRFFEWARAHYDHVVIDTPIAMAVPGVTEMARAGASVLLVHRPGWAPAQVLGQVREHLALSKITLAGVVLNGVRTRWAGSGYFYLPYYGSSRRTPAALGETPES